MFVNENRDKIKSANPNLSVTEISQLLGQQWRELGTDAKQKYVEQANADKSRYARELEKWKQEHPEEVTAMAAQSKGARRAKKVHKKTQGGPKRATTAYFFFTAAIREQTKQSHPGLKVTELSKVIGQKWQSLGADEKQKYEAMAANDKARYEQEKKSWVPDSKDAESKPNSASVSKQAAQNEDVQDDSDEMAISSSDDSDSE